MPNRRINQLPDVSPDGTEYMILQNSGDFTYGKTSLSTITDTLGGAVPEATTDTSGKIRLSNDLAGTASSPIVKTSTVTITVGLENAQRTLANASDYATINQAISDVKALGGGTVVLRAGSYTPSDHIRCREGVDLVGEKNARITLAQGKSIVMFEDDCSIQNITVDASAHIINDKAVQISNNGASLRTDITVQNCRLLNCCFGVFTSASNGCVVSRVKVIGNYITGRGYNDLIGGGPVGAGNNLATGHVTDFLADDNTVIQDSSQGDHYKYALDMVRGENIRFLNNTVEGGVIFGSEQSPHIYCQISNNTITNPKGHPTAQVGFLVDSESLNPGRHIIISKNTINNGFISAINSNSSVFMRGVSITGNVINATGVLIENGEAGIKCTSLEGAIIEGNIVTDSDGDGIWLANCRSCNVASNSVIGSTEQGIKENNNPLNNVYSNNIVSGNTAGNLSPINSSSVAFNTANVNPERFYATGDISGSVTFRRSNGKSQLFTATGDISASIQNGSVAGDELTIAIRQDGTGGWEISWSTSNIIWNQDGPVQLTSSASALTTVTFVWAIVSGGSYWFRK